MPRKAEFVRIVQASTYVEKLEAIRDHLSASLLVADAREKASISRELRATLHELKLLKPEKKEASHVDVLRSQRESDS